MKDMWLWYTTGEYSDSSHLIDVKKGRERERLCDRFQLLPSPAVIPEDICAKTKHRRTAPLTQNRPHNTLGPTPLRLCVCAVLFPWVLIHPPPFPSIHNSREAGLAHSPFKLYHMPMGDILPQGLPDGCHHNHNQYDFPSCTWFDSLKCLASINIKTILSCSSTLLVCGT